MKHLITIIGTDGSIKTSSEENISVEERDKEEKYSHNTLFTNDIYPSAWWCLHGLDLTNDEEFTSSLDKIASLANLITILDISYITKDDLNHNAIHIVSPSLHDVTEEQKESLKNIYNEEINHDNLEATIIDCVNDYDIYDISSFHSITDYFTALGISNTNNKHR
ncbi:MAG TPA: hypothetical protein IAB45_02525 [Candidatus Onthousia faecavium]|nr:hypothetical protein [Candidatus Onthousia faecavium]